MDRKRFTLGAFAIVMALYTMWRWQNHPRKVENDSAPLSHAHNVESTKAIVQKHEDTPIPKVEPSPTRTAEPKESLAALSKTLFEYTRPDSKLKDLVSELERSGQRPLVTHDSNSDTGEMAIVRTRHPLPGTRYFHAQFFGDQDGGEFAQHISFEYQASPSAMREVIQALTESFNLSEPGVARDGYARWQLTDGRILWVKRMELEDLREDPFNAYSEQDVGTIRVAIESEIH